MTLSVVPGSGITFTAGSTGLISGLTTLVDQNPMVVTTSLITRSNYFYGMIVDDGSGPPHRAYGFVLVRNYQRQLHGADLALSLSQGGLERSITNCAEQQLEKSFPRGA